MHTALTVANITAFDLGVVALGYFDAWAQYVLDLYSLHDLLGTLSLQVDAHHMAI